MFLLAHLGIGLGLAWLLNWKSNARIDYRLVLFGSILPDLIDKPLGIVLGLETRIWAHTFLFLFAFLALSFVPGWRAIRFIGFGAATHLLLDAIWRQPDVALYPIAGWAFPPAPFDASFWFDTLLRDPIVQAGEIIGAGILIGFFGGHRIRSWRALGAFLRHGTLPSPETNSTLNKVD